MLKLLASATVAEHRSAREIRRQWLITCALFCAALWLYTRHNDFPFYYHPDEPGKVAQLRDGTRNFNHPLLLLTTTDVARRLGGVTTDCQQIVEIGRACSATFAAAVVALFSWLGFHRFGVIGGILAGVAMLLQRRLYEHAHFMKEDAALLAGIALTFVAIDAFGRKPAWLRAGAVGAAAAVAASGKYIGLVMVGFAMAALAASGGGSLGQRTKWTGFAIAFLLTAVVINYPAVAALPDLAGGFGGEITRLNSRSGVEVEFSRFGWLRRLLDVSPFLLVLFLFHLSRLRQLTRPDLLLTAFPLVLGLILSFSSKQSGRHMLPALMVVVFLGTMAAIRLAQELEARRWKFAHLLLTAFLVCAAAYDIVATSLLDRGFERDHRRELVAWINANVPPEATVGVEDRVGIPYQKARRFCDLPPPLRQQVRGARSAADLGSLDEVRASGMTHIAVTESQSEVFLKKNLSAAQQADPAFQRRREFYRRLFAEGRLVWSRETGSVGVLNPSLRLYEIAAPASSELNVGR